MNASLNRWCRGLFFLALLGGLTSVVQAEEIKVEAVLVWGTNEDPGKFKHLKPVDDKLAKILRSFKWKSYFEINRKTVTAPQGKQQTCQISGDCKLIITYEGNSQVRVRLYGKGELVFDKVQPISLGGSAVFGGDDKNDTAWFIFLTRLPVK